MEKPGGFWVALIAGMLLVIERHKEKPLLSRMLIASASGGIGYSLAPDAAAWTGRSETLAVMILTAFGYLALDIVSGLISDREFIKQLIRDRFGKREG